MPYNVVSACDVGGARVLSELKRIAPVTAVRGNMDAGPWAGALPLTAELEIDGVWIHMLHIVDELALDPSAAGFAAVIHGHSHRPGTARRRGVLSVNPGSAGPRRFKLPATVALVRVGRDGVRARIVEL